MASTAAERAVAVVAAALADAAVTTRALASDQLGFEVECGGWPLEAGVRAEGPVLRVQAPACGPGQIDPHELLHDHRKRPFVRFTHAACGTVWIEGELPLEAVTPALADHLLGAFIEAAELVRARATRSTPGSRPPTDRAG